MKTGIAALVGVLAGASAIFGFYQINPPGTEQLSAVEQELKDAVFDRDASQKVETRLRKQVAELRREKQSAVELADTTSPVPETPDPTDEATKKEESPMAEVMKSFGKAKSDLAFKTLVARMGLEGAELEAFKASFDAAGVKRQEAFATMFSKGATLEHFALIDGATPDVDAWVAENLDDVQQEDYAAYKGEQEQNRIDRKANEELTMLGSIANLTADQKDAAFDIFAEHVATEPPENLLEMSGPEDFSPYLDQVMTSRIEALTPILDESQLETYKEQSQLWRKMAEGMLSAEDPK
jgi:hypothetical protein